ncbi:neurochondrin [Calliopsis andreniformis]|uniref:neurochondrin n=1 Tax=Calliopsis andreniformis TaxID=337506 RepID=UPI003FCEBF2D
MSLPEGVKKCVAILKAVESDSEKFAALFMVTKLVDSKDCTPEVKKILFEAIGAKFMKKLLSTQTVPMDCPPQVYKSVALSILSAFCGESELASHPDMIAHVPALLNIISQVDEDAADDMLIIVSEAYTCLQNIAQYPPGQKALLEQKAVTKMCDIYSEKSFQTDQALNILVTLVGTYGPEAWDEDTAPFHAIINKIALDFETDHTERKFELCTILQALLMSCRRDAISVTAKEESWPLSIHKALSDIFGPKIGKKQRDPALKLASVMMDLLGAEWALLDKEKPKVFFLLLILLASIEVRMQLEGTQLKTVMANADLVTSCFTILEISIMYITTDQLDLEEKEKQSLYTALKGAFAAVISLITAVSKMKNLTDIKQRLFICAAVRVLAAWLAQETKAMRPQVYAILPYILTVANDTFYAHRNRKLAEKAKANAKAKGDEDTSSKEPIIQDPLSEIDILRLLLPALCYLAVDENARKILLQHKQEEVLFECLSYHWTIVHYKKPPVPKAERLKALKEAEKGEDIELHLSEAMKDSRTAMVSVCNVLMNITVLEPKLVEESPIFVSLLKFCFNNLPELKQIPENLVLHGHLAVLGLLLLKQQAKLVKKNDFSICRYIQATIRFLWDAYIIDESNDPTELVVSMPYKEHWMEIMELWFLGMQTMAGVLQVVPWLSQFALESGWAEDIIETLKKVKIGSLQPNVKSAFEDLLCHLVKADQSVANVLKKCGALTVCRNHRMMELGKNLFGD